MTDDDRDAQREMHDALEALLGLEDGHLLTGWVVCYETATVSGSTAVSGHMYGPESMTTWKAIGLIEWTNRFSLAPDNDD